MTAIAERTRRKGCYTLQDSVVVATRLAGDEAADFRGCADRAGVTPAELIRGILRAEAVAQAAGRSLYRAP